MTTLIEVSALQERMDVGLRTVLLDVRWALGDPDGRADYLRGHIPGAVYVDLEADLSGPGSPQQGRHPLPEPRAFAESARRWGISDGDTVVAYDDGGSTSAARLWWLLRDAGFDRVLLLNGGLGAWRAAGCPLATDDEQPAAGDVVLSSGRMPVVGMGARGFNDVAEWAATGILLDARAGERYRGETEPVDPRAGHIPGAVSAPTSQNLSADRRFLPAEELAARFAALGVTAAAPIAVYCGSGVTAAHEIAALEIAGIRAALFPGSWSAWSSHAGLPVATGAEPGGRRHAG
ncbi:sulfurtransferase [Paenarthrobacter sp. PH39-S1]|uniref:sulfurtransferase n=1 Tax=Paenarthrobacter sp. PH39-S1 TaxID=3046204 RepID=UPI0024BAA309|nr:sulfurtransferase [Paenarthrobacter sp. PH39-S1]MDJ0357226.1 sulfurtransferase [Paenarthrobacter sp. PH39-S1]